MIYLATLFPAARAEIIRLLFADSSRSFHLRELAVMLTGHIHNFQHLNDGGRVNYFIIGSGAAPRPDVGSHRFAKFTRAGTAGFAAIIVKRDAIEVRFVDKAGVVFYKTEVRDEAKGR